MSAIAKLARQNAFTTPKCFTDTSAVRALLQRYAKEPSSVGQIPSIRQRLQNPQLFSSQGGLWHKQYMFLRRDKSHVENTGVQPTVLINKLADSVFIVSLFDEIPDEMLKDCCGSLLSCTMTPRQHLPNSTDFYRLLVSVCLNEMSNMYVLSAILLSRNYTPVQIKSSAGRKRLCRFINYVNSLLSYGSYSVDPESGRVKFRICPILQKPIFDKRISNNQLLAEAVHEDMEILQRSCSQYMPKIMKVYSEEYRQSADQLTQDILAQLLPVLEQSVPFNEVISNAEDLRYPALSDKLVEQSEEEYKNKCQAFRQNYKAINEARTNVNRFTRQDPLPERDVTNVCGTRKRLIDSQLFESYGKLLEKQKQIITTTNDAKVCSDIIPLVEPNERRWVVYSTTTNSELRRQKVEFRYDVPNYDNDSQKHRQVKLLSLKCPLFVDDNMLTFDSPIRRQAELVKIFRNTSCVQIAKYYTMAGASMNLGKLRRVKYSECVMSDYYTYRGIDFFTTLNCKTLSSLTKMSLIAQAAMGLTFLKNIHITHCDFKWSNVLLAKGYIAKISDFGDAHFPITEKNRGLTQLREKDMERHPGFTIPYSPPEAFSSQIDFEKQGHKYDVYSFGVMLMQLLFECFPITIRKFSHQMLIKALKNGTYRELILMNVERLYYYIAGEAAEVLCYIAMRCLDPDPNRRPCIDWIQIMVRNLHSYVEKTCS